LRVKGRVPAVMPRVARVPGKRMMNAERKSERWLRRKGVVDITASKFEEKKGW
jgi:hypothetical protein